jgi:signal transduction histidine kinase
VSRRRPGLIAALLTTTLAITAVLGWLGWRLLDQERSLDQQRAGARIDSAADTIAARVAGRLAEVGEHLSTWVSDASARPPLIEHATVLTIAPDAVTVTPRGSLPFVPVLHTSAPIATNIFDKAEGVELREARPRLAAEQYRAIAARTKGEISAEALVRLGAVLRKAGDFHEALDVYRQLTGLGEVRAARLPAELVGLHGQRATLQALGDRAGEARVAADLVRALDVGRWMLLRGPAEFYRDEFSDVPRGPSWQLAATVDDIWREHETASATRGQRIDGGEPAMLVLWRSNGRRTALLATFTDAFFNPLGSDGVGWKLTSADGRLLSGTPSAAAPAVTRVSGTNDHPLVLNVWALANTSNDRRQRRAVLWMMTAVLLFLWTATYFMVRAIRREARVAQLQTDFVAAVSHEFRSPLTTVRQMAEMLEMGRITSDERRHTYYRTLATEATRLQHLVETLLNFGRMEAGAAQYRFSTVALARVVDTIVRELEPRLRECGKQIEVSGPAGAAVDADESALTMALRNVVDNAIKYSPGQPAIWIRWADEGDRVAISVIDRGVGIPRSEHDAIFGKFVRGRAAIAASIKGTGVGLSMVRQIVMAHGGEIRLDSETGAGSTFTIALRRAVPEALLNSSPVSGMERAL